MSKREEALAELNKLIKPRFPGFFTQLIAVGVSNELEITVTTYLFGNELKARTIVEDSPVFKAVLYLRENSLAEDMIRVYSEGPVKPWFRVWVDFTAFGEPDARFDYFDEPRPRGNVLSEASLALDLIEYPRVVDELPNWYRERIGFGKSTRFPNHNLLS
jgi:hypothetical protein